MPRRLMYTSTEGLWKEERPGARWGDEVRRDETMLGIKSWRVAAAVNGEVGRKFLKEAKNICAL
jgi:hypothetical protein